MTINSAYASSKNRGTSNQQNSCGNDDLQRISYVKIIIRKIMEEIIQYL